MQHYLKVQLSYSRQPYLFEHHTNVCNFPLLCLCEKCAAVGMTKFLLADMLWF